MTKVLVASGNFKKSYAIFRSLRRCGMEIAAVFYTDGEGKRLSAPNMFSRYLSARYLAVHPIWDERGYVYGVIDAARDFAADVILPSGFSDFVALSKHKRLVEESTGARLASPEYEKILAASDKRTLPELCASLGILTPKTLRLDERETRVEEAARMIRRELRPPYVVKGTGDAAQPAFYIDPEAAARDAVSRRGLVQEFVVGDEFGYFALAARGRSLLEFMHKRIVKKGALGGPSLMASAFFDAELLALGRRIVAGLEWDGVVMAEFRRDSETGDYYLIELNPKFWGSLDLAVEALADFPATLVRAALGESRSPAIVFRKVTFSWLAYATYKYVPSDPLLLCRFLKETVRRKARVDVWLSDPAVTFRVLTMTVTARPRKRPPGKAPIGLRDLAASLLERAALSFDLDGTLVELPIRWRKLYQEARRRGLVRRGAGLLATMYRLSRAGDRERAQKIHELVKEYEVGAASTLRRNARLARGLAKLRELVGGLKILLVTKQSRESALVALERLGVDGLFDGIVSREDSLLREEQLRAVSEALGKGLVHAGDTLVDVVSALRAGAVPVLIARDRYGLRQGSELGVPVFETAVEFVETLVRYVEKCDARTPSSSSGLRWSA